MIEEENLNTLENRDTDENAAENIRIKIIGVGGAGNNAVDRLKLDNLRNVNLAVVNTDGQVLASSPLEEKLLIGGKITRGLGAGGEAELGQQAACEDRESLRRLVEGIDLVFLLAGLGGGTGSGALPVLAETAAEEGALVIAFVTMPFTLEGERRLRQAEDSLVALRSSCHAVIPLPNDILLQQVDENATVLEAFAIADDWINRGVRAIWDLLNKTGLINIDFATLRESFDAQGGKTLFGLGRGEGGDFVNKAINDLMLCPLLHTPGYSRRADNLIVNVTGGADLTLTKVNEVIAIVAEKFGSKENTVIGAVIDESLQNTLSICVLGTTDVEGRVSSSRKTIQSLTKNSGEKEVPSVKAKELKSAVNALDIQGRPKKVHRSKLKPGKSKKGEGQPEFDFTRTEEQRGYFEKTDRNLYEGEDLDVPTYLRRGIKVCL